MAEPDRLPRSALQSRRLQSWTLLIIAGAAVGFAFAAPIAPWYTISSNIAHWTIQNSTFSLNGTTTFLPGSDYRFACYTLPVTAPVWGSICVQTQQASGGILQPYASGLG
ncbi:MAG: hypothetical protein L3J97_04930, partial [Thermoplasmata archaeon]|nr:hypothetical protein [Thermoplasmata archaeon]